MRVETVRKCCRETRRGLYPPHEMDCSHCSNAMRRFTAHRCSSLICGQPMTSSSVRWQPRHTSSPRTVLQWPMHGHSEVISTEREVARIFMRHDYTRPKLRDGLQAAQAQPQPFAPNIILFATNFFASGRQSSALSAAARPALISGNSFENRRTRPSVKCIPASRSVRRWLQ